MIYHGDLIHVLPTLAADSIDACATDPPYELGFMSKKWDRSGVANDVKTWQAIYRVLKPGAHMVVFGGTRTFHRMTVAVEDAGFEIRDCLSWLYGQGFPKSLDIGKAMDKAAGVEREVVGKAAHSQPAKSGHHGGLTGQSIQHTDGRFTPDVTAPATDAAKQWDGWGTALKPAWEPIILARKPLSGTVIDNVQVYGTGGLNIDGSLIHTDDNLNGGAYAQDASPRYDGEENWRYKRGESGEFAQPEGRWPANVLLDEDAAALLDGQTGELSKGHWPNERGAGGISTSGHVGQTRLTEEYATEFGGASRFFYVAKPSRTERDEGCYDLPQKSGGQATDRKDGSAGVNNPRAGSGRTGGARNFHPTVKPVELMHWLVKLITPPEGIVLDPFLGSGTTGVAARLLECQFIGIEKEAEYVQIAQRRISEAMPLVFGHELITIVT